MLDIQKPLITLFSGVILFLLAQINFERVLSLIKKKTDPILDELMFQLDLMFFPYRRATVDNFLLILACVFAGIFLILFWPHFYVSIIIFYYTVTWFYKLPLKITHFIRRQRINKFTLQMVDALTLMANGMRAGLNISQAMGMVKNEMKDPIRQEFNLVLQQTLVGASLESAFAQMAQRLPCDDVEMFVTSINILKETGGNLAETFDTIANTIRGRIKLQSKISAMVQQGVVQASIVFCMPFGLGIVLYLGDPETMGLMFEKPLGWVFLGIMLLFQIIGGVVLKKIITIKV